MRSAADTMHLVVMVHPHTSQYAENWRHPLVRTGWLDARFYADLARMLERGFDIPPGYGAMALSGGVSNVVLAVEARPRLVSASMTAPDSSNSSRTGLG